MGSVEEGKAQPSFAESFSCVHLVHLVFPFIFLSFATQKKRTLESFLVSTCPLSPFPDPTPLPFLPPLLTPHSPAPVSVPARQMCGNGIRCLAQFIAHVSGEESAQTCVSVVFSWLPAMGCYFFDRNTHYTTHHKHCVLALRWKRWNPTVLAPLPFVTFPNHGLNAPCPCSLFFIRCFLFGTQRPSLLLTLFP